MVDTRDPRRLTQLMEAALRRANLEDGAQLLERLERLEPDEPRWSQRAGDVYRRMQRPELAIAAYGRAIDRFSRAGFTARAVAMAKVIASFDTTSRSAAARLDGRAPDSEDSPPEARQGRTTFGDGWDTETRGWLTEESAGRPSLGDAPVEHDELYPDIELSLDDSPREDPPDEVQGSSPAEAVILEQSAGPSLNAEPFEPEEFDPTAPRSSDSEGEPTESDAELHAVFRLLRSTRAFAAVDDGVVLELARRSCIVRLAQGGHVLAAGHAVYLIAQGKARHLGEERAPRSLGPGDAFGERALLVEDPYALELSVQSDLLAVEIPALTLKQLGRSQQTVDHLITQLLARPLLIRLLESSPLFSKLAHEARRQMVRSFELQEVKAQTLLVRNLEPGHGMYISVTCAIEVVMADGATRVLPAGSSVGQPALLSREPFTYTARTLGDGVLLYLSAARYAKVLETFAPTVDSTEARTEARSSAGSRRPGS